MKALVESKQLSLFSSGYWGHPAYHLPPEANLLAVAHYIEALEFQKDYIRIHAVLGGKNPHLQTYLVGGMATSMDPNEPGATINPERITFLTELASQSAGIRRSGLRAGCAGGGEFLSGLVRITERGWEISFLMATIRKAE